MRSTGYTYQFKLLVGQEYELEKKLEGGDGSNQYTKQLGQNDQVPHKDQVKGETRDRLAKEHGISPKAVQRSADLYKAHKAIGEVAPDRRKRRKIKSVKMTVLIKRNS